MNRTQLIVRIIERLYDKSDHADLKQILEEELPDFQRIDEEKFKRIYASKVCDIGLHIKEYNSTLPPALVPLPKEMPKEYNSLATPYQVWLKVRQDYGTPAPKPSLPTVEELRDKMYRWVGSVDLDECEILAQNLHEKYSLPTREWWQDLKEGDKFMYAGQAIIHSGNIYLGVLNSAPALLKNCTPYTPPTADDIIKKHNLSEEEVRVIREGK